MSDFDQRNCDFSKGMADAQYAYIEAERRVKYLEAENAKLREQVTQLQEERDLFRELFHLTTEPDRYVQVRAENAKLRELVKNLHACNGSCPRCIELMGKCEYEEQLAECGIEVDV